MLNSLMSYLGSTLSPGAAGNELWALIYVVFVFMGVSAASIALYWIEHSAGSAPCPAVADGISNRETRFVFWIAPIIGLLAAFAAYAVIPFGPSQAVTDVNIGALLILGVLSLNVLSILLSGCVPNSRGALLTALISGARMVLFQVPIGLVAVAAILMTSLNESGTGTLSMIGIVQAQEDQGTWFLFKFFPIGLIAFTVFVIGLVAQTRGERLAVAAERPSDAGAQNEYDGLRRLLLIFGEYAAMIAVSSVAVTLWLGGWLRPFASQLSAPSWENIFSLFPGFTFLLLTAILLVMTVRGGSPSRPRRTQLAVVAALFGLIAALLFMIAVAGRTSDRHILASRRENVNYLYWFAAKVAILLSIILYYRSARSLNRFGRYFDQSTRLAWKILVPISLGVLALTAIVGLKHETWDQAKQLLRMRS